MRLSVYVMLFAAAAVGCGSRTTSTVLVGSDGPLATDIAADSRVITDANVADDVDEAVDRSMAFCSGGAAAKAELNGQPLDVLEVTGEVIAMGCCDGAAVRLVVKPRRGAESQEATVLGIGFSRFAGSGDHPQPPIKLDLAGLPLGWELYVVHWPCAEAAGACLPKHLVPETATIRGTADINGPSFYDGTMRVSVCIEAFTSVASANATLQAIRLYAHEVRIPSMP